MRQMQADYQARGFAEAANPYTKGTSEKPPAPLASVDFCSLRCCKSSP